MKKPEAAAAPANPRAGALRHTYVTTPAQAPAAPQPAPATSSDTAEPEKEE